MRLADWRDSGKVGLSLHRIRRAEQVIALVETGLVAFDDWSRKTIQLPIDFLAALENCRAGQPLLEMEKH